MQSHRTADCQPNFMPADFRLTEARQAPLKDQYDEWLARIICYAFSVPVWPFLAQVNWATGETMRLQATQEGLAPLRARNSFAAIDEMRFTAFGKPQQIRA